MHSIGYSSKRSEFTRAIQKSSVCQNLFSVTTEKLVEQEPQFWVGLSWVPIVGPADPILRVETAFREFHLATSTEIGSCRFPSGLLTFAGTAVLHMLSSSSH